jgi:Pyruvate flavodoxin/ferredoxin oxidoreductase, thiamine diP-bdg
MDSKTTLIAVDGNEAAARVAHRLSEVIAIYPITPSSPMGELADAWSAAGRTNLWGAVPQVIEMQSEGGAAGALSWNGRFVTLGASRGVPCGSTREARPPRQLRALLYAAPAGRAKAGHRRLVGVGGTIS